MGKSRSEKSKFSETPSKAALRRKGPFGRHDRETGPSSRAKRRIQGLEKVPNPKGRPLATDPPEVLATRRKTPKRG
ncbi:MAG: hypothetical protein HY071_04280 [Chloroflexi bacterium]|nr:hypothetical protein [Chloroflexota bacterium]